MREAAAATTVFDRVKKWSSQNDAFGRRVYEIYDKIDYHAQRRFHEYHPTIGPYPEFWLRFRNWLDCATKENDQKRLFELVEHLFFAGTREFNALYRAAFAGPVARWLIDQEPLDLSDVDLTKRILEAAGKTWFCPITDSMQIAAFYHVNHLTGRNERPDWHSLSKFGAGERIQTFMEERSIGRLVLLEDFVGSGMQMQRAVSFATSLTNTPSILIVPLIACPSGLRVGRQLEDDFPQVTFNPVLSLEQKSFIGKEASVGEDVLFPFVRELAERLYVLVSDGIAADNAKKPYGPFGFAETGALAVMYSNCPDNTLPLIHNRSNAWDPIFPRSTRV